MFVITKFQKGGIVMSFKKVLLVSLLVLVAGIFYAAEKPGISKLSTEPYHELRNLVPK